MFALTLFMLLLFERLSDTRWPCMLQEIMRVSHGNTPRMNLMPVLSSLLRPDQRLALIFALNPFKLLWFERLSDIPLYAS